ncbi:Serine/Threonine protein kinase and Signal Transduction Histidine Kinase (STHK) with GAF sensor [Planktothrix serta PCC 8927]|uniref:histidine kinase n=1 Tax=Planktothrix serta PCC 8927 TaxID=671068 RepID=A0A7Z9BXM1_9CYAN|nr:Serine/Threonine protein kinase and Signal Transduction Histidine Kinase (STHK) with GAF sensor [Planktothrix serta PCC 8927]
MVMNLWKKSLLFQLVSSFLILSLVIISLVGYMAFSQAKESLKKSIFNELNMAASLKREELNHWVFDQSQVVLALARIPEIRTSAKTLFTLDKSTQEYKNIQTSLQTSLSAFTGKNSGLKEIFILSRGGRILVSTDASQIGKYQPLVQYSDIQSENQNAFVSNFYRSPITGYPQITLVDQILDQEGKRLGLLAAHLNLDRIDEVIREQTNLDQTGETYLVGNIGSGLSNRYVFIASQKLGSEEFPDGINSAGIEQVMQGKSGESLYRNYRGTPVIGVYYSLGNKDLGLIVEKSQAEAFIPAQHLASYILLIGLILSGFMAVAMFFLGRQIVQPILAIVKTARVISQGDFKQTAPVLSNNEIGLLAKTFNQMTGQLQIYYHQLEDYNRNLELKVTERTQELEDKNQCLIDTLKELKQTQSQLIQNEKMVSLGQLVAGVAHEINNPVSFIYGNLDFASDYGKNLIKLVEAYQNTYPEPGEEIEEMIEQIDLEFIKTDLPKLYQSMKEGSNRIKQIVLSLKNFSRLDESEQKRINIHEGIDSTLQILQTRLKPQSYCPAIQVIKNYDQLPLINCYPGQLNQVYMNLLSNAIDALQECWEEQNQIYLSQQPQITITTRVIDQKWIEILVKDNASGIPPDVKSRIFDPFFTTKPVGKGTGLGLSISYKIIVDKHQGQLKCSSKIGEGTEFMIKLPIVRSELG